MPKKKAGKKADKKTVKEQRRDNRRAAELQREYRRAEVASLYVRGRTAAEIADAVGVSPHTIQNDMKIIRERWRETYIEDFARGVVDELGKLEQVWSEAWKAWENSKRDTVTTEVIDNEGENNGRTKKEKRVSSAGNPRFLEVLCNITRQRLEALGAVVEAKRKERESQGNYGDGYEVLTVVIGSRADAQQAMTLDHFRHQFAGYEVKAEDTAEDIESLIEQQTKALEEAEPIAQESDHGGEQPRQ